MTFDNRILDKYANKWCESAMARTQLHEIDFVISRGKHTSAK